MQIVPIFIAIKSTEEVSKGGEKRYWEDIDPSYMSEESTHDSDGEITVQKHTLSFRSDGRFVV